MACFYRLLRLAALVMSAGALPGYGQAVSGSAASSATVMDALHQMADRADVVFVGQVTSVARIDGGGAASGVIEVRFQVDQAVRGCVAGTPYVLREWAGLWEGGDQRYRVGQRLLMLLHAPGASGMSSPVDGLDGAIPIVRGGSGLLAAGSSARQAPPSVDLRWVGTKLERAVSYRSSPVHAGQQASPGLAQPRMVHAVAGGTVTQVAPMVVSPAASGLGEASVPAQQASVDAVVGMLRGWQSASQSEGQDAAAQ